MYLDNEEADMRQVDEGKREPGDHTKSSKYTISSHLI